MTERSGIIAAGNMLVDHVHQIVQWPQRGWLAEIVHSERSTGGAPLNVLLTLAKMHVGLPLQAVGLVGDDHDGDYIMAMLDQYHVNRQHVHRTTFAPTSMSQVMTDPSARFSTHLVLIACSIYPPLTALNRHSKSSISVIYCCSIAWIWKMQNTARAAHGYWRRWRNRAMKPRLI